MVHTARGQATVEGVDADSLRAMLQRANTPLNIDSLIAAAQAGRAQLGLSVTPVYVGNVIGNVTFVQMKNGLQTHGQAWGGTNLTGSLRLDKKVYRLQERFEENKNLGLNANHHFGPGTALEAGFSDGRQFSRTVAINGGYQDFILNNTVVSGAINHQQPRGRRLRYDARVGGSAVNGEKTFKTDQTQSASVNGGVAYTRLVMGSIVTVGVRGALRQAWETSRTASGVDVTALRSFQGDEVEPLGALEDSVSASFTAFINDSTRVRVNYMDYQGVRSYADQARGSTGGQIQDESALIWEKETRYHRGIEMNLEAAPFPRVRLKMAAHHRVTGSDYLTQLTRISENTTDAISADLTYRSLWGSDVTVRVERTEQFKYLGPQSVGSFDDVRRRFNVNLRHNFKPTLTFSGSYDTQIAQSFYRNPDNPRDRDQLDNSVNATLSSTPWRPLRVNLSGSYVRTDFVNIDASQSFNNRVKQRYDLRPGFDLKVTDRFNVQQNYGMAWELTEFPFHPDDDALDRTITFSNTFRFRFTERLDARFDYLLDLHDRGAYIPVEGTPEELRDTAPRYFIPTSEDRRDRVAAGMRYQMNPHLAAVLEYDYSQKVDFADGPGNDRITTDGGIEGGVVGRYTWGEGRELRFELKKANRFGAFNNELQNDFWIANSELRYTF